MARTRMFGKNNQRGITWKLSKGEQSFLCATHRPDLLHIPIKLHEDIMKSYGGCKNVDRHFWKKIKGA